MKALRYDNLVREIEAIRPRRIVEVGTCKGERAELMIREAVRYRTDVEYIGFDLFEPPPDEELSARKHPWPLGQVSERLDGLGADVRLIKGDTHVTLRNSGLADVDLVFLDGGHSDETVLSDFDAVLGFISPGASIMLDDYWNYPTGGCNALVDRLDRKIFSVEKLEPVDQFAKPYGNLRTQIVRVKKL